MKLFLSFLPVLAACVCASCGVSTSYSSASKPSTPYQVAVVSDFKYKVAESTANGPTLTKEFTSVIVEEVQTLQRFSKVTDGAYSGRAVRIEGDVTVLEEGNSALRIGLGMGLGKSHFFCTTRFIDNTTGKLIGTLQVERSSKQGMMGIADNFPLIRRSAACDIAEKAVEFATTP